MQCIRWSPGWPIRVKWWTKCKMMERTDCCSTFCTEPSTGEYLPKGPVLSKLKDDPGILKVGRKFVAICVCTFWTHYLVKRWMLRFDYLNRILFWSVVGEFAEFLLCALEDSCYWVAPSILKSSLAVVFIHDNSSAVRGLTLVLWSISKAYSMKSSDYFASVPRASAK